jgi:type IV secretion system protein VirD4
MELLVYGFIVFVFAAIAWERHRLKVQRRKLSRAAYDFAPANVHGGARWAGIDDLRRAGLLKGKGIPIGYSPDGRHALHFSGTGHILTIAAARTGKGATLISNALITSDLSCICVDPKAENAAITAHRRRRFGNVFILNPFNMLPDALKGLKNARFNPMQILDPASSAFHATCDKLAAALVWDEGREGMHFTTAARMLVSGVIAALTRHGSPAEKNLAAVARVISGDIRGFCRITVQGTTDPFIAQKLGRFAYAAPDNREVNDVISTAITQLGFIGNAAIAESLSGSDFRFSDLKRNPGTTVYICLPLNMLDICDKYFRLILETALSDLLNEGQRGAGKPVLAIVDEMAQLGPHMKSLENAMGMASGAANLIVWGILQSLVQLQGMFPTTWEVFIQGCALTTWFGVRDETSREYVSKLSGACEILTRSRGVSFDNYGMPHVSDNASQHARPLLLPHEVGQLAPDEMIAFVEGVTCGPVKAKRKPYWRVFGRRCYRDNPYVRKSRSLLERLFG